MLKQLITTVCGAALFAGVLLAAKVGHTANTSAIIGHEWPTPVSPSTFSTCFLGTGNFMENKCGGAGTTKKLVVPVTITSFKTFTLSGRFKGNGTSTATTCRGIRWDDSGAATLSTAASTTSSSPGTFSLGSLNVTSGNLTFECDVAYDTGSQRGAVLWVDWF